MTPKRKIIHGCCSSIILEPRQSWDDSIFNGTTDRRCIETDRTKFWEHVPVRTVEGTRGLNIEDTIL